MRTLLSGGLLIDPSQGLEGRRDLLMEDGKIAAVLAPGKADALRRQAGVRVIDVSKQWVLPGLIDMHVHLREPGREEDETIATAARAAARGGVATVLAMPNTEPVIDSAPLVHFLLERARAQAVVNVLVSGAVTRGQRGLELTEMGEMARAGAVAVTDDGRPVMNAQVMRRALEYSKTFGLPLLDHCEDVHLSAGGVMNEGPSSLAKGLAGIPAAAETVMAMRDIALAELTGGRLHLCHVSCAATVDLVRRAKRRGARVSAETAPHYFTLTDEDIPGYDADFKMNPPLRTPGDVAAVREGILDGTLDAIATDHAPHHPGKKALGLAEAPFGVIGLETLLPLSLSLLGRGGLGRKALVDRLSGAPARILGLKTKGSLAPGMDADVTVVDADFECRVTPDFSSKSRNSPFLGRRLRGRASWVWVAGKAIVEEGRPPR